MIHLLIALLTMPPLPAAELVARNPREARTLRRIAKRESYLTPISIHAGDSHLGRSAWEKAVKAGILWPTTCPFHRQGSDAREWATRGSWGHMAAYAMQYLPCLPPWVLDIPIISAWVAQKRLDRARQRGAPQALRAWAGV